MLRVVSTTDGSALTATLARIEREFGPGAEVRARKCRLRRLLRFPDRPLWRARYGVRAAIIAEAIMCHRANDEFATAALHVPARRLSALEIAIRVVERHYRTERDTVAIACALGRGNHMSLVVLSELRLLLRFLRRTAAARQFPKILSEFAS